MNALRSDARPLLFQSSQAFCSCEADEYSTHWRTPTKSPKILHGIVLTVPGVLCLGHGIWAQVRSSSRTEVVKIGSLLRCHAILLFCFGQLTQYRQCYNSNTLERHNGACQRIPSLTSNPQLNYVSPIIASGPFPHAFLNPKRAI